MKLDQGNYSVTSAANNNNDNNNNIGGYDITDRTLTTSLSTYKLYNRENSRQLNSDNNHINQYVVDVVVGDTGPESLSWHNIDVYSKVDSKVKIPFLMKNKNNKQSVHILKNVSGQAKPGQLMAIMGSSGAGKTTLMNVLTQRNLTGYKLNGSVKLNDRPMDRNQLKQVAAYVQQDDLFIGSLTVREHLKFQARLRMHPLLSATDRSDKVNKVAKELGLMKCIDATIGTAETKKGISGGEKKRLAFASELLTDPSILFCDEPTSGLDSFMTLNVCEVLQNMASNGKTIICTIHQPSSEAFALFNQLLLMADGRVAYLGTPENALDYFSKLLGLNCPNNYNPADFYIKHLSVIPGDEIQSKIKANDICNKFSSSNYSKLSMPSTDSINSSSSSSRLMANHYKTNWFIQFGQLLWRSSITTFRDPLLTRILIAQSAITAIIFGLIYFQLDLDQVGILNINGALYLLLMKMNLTSLFGVVNTFCLEVPIFHREHDNGLYRVSSYFLAKMIAENNNNNLDKFFYCLLTCILIANCATGLAYLVSCLSKNSTMALTIAPAILMPLMIFGGFFLNNDSIPDYFIWIKYISWFYYGNEALVINQWLDITSIPCTTSKQSSTTNGSVSMCIPDGPAVIKSLNFNPDNFGRDLWILLAIIVLLRFMAYSLLWIKSLRK
ncbi:protein white-like [Oppia nitens]|uniref:protein white-like n=1 Tax=Oppia nitens TaxID=1686743 RepID=UPI0023DB7916|nr:protein white-like [Oppia nitens]